MLGEILRITARPRAQLDCVCWRGEVFCQYRIHKSLPLTVLPLLDAAFISPARLSIVIDTEIYSHGRVCPFDADQLVVMP